MNGHRDVFFVRMLRRSGLPVTDSVRGRFSMPGFSLRIGGQNGYGQHHLGEPGALDELVSRRPESIPVTIRHFKGTPYEDAVVSMRAKDWVTLMNALVQSDPDRYMLSKEN